MHYLVRTYILICKLQRVWQAQLFYIQPQPSLIVSFVVLKSSLICVVSISVVCLNFCYIGINDCVVKNGFVPFTEQSIVTYASKSVEQNPRSGDISIVTVKNCLYAP